MFTKSIFILILLCQSVHGALMIDDSSSEQQYEFPDTCGSDYKKDNWKECASDLSTFIWNTQTWYDNEPINICQVKCSRVLKGHVSSKFQWVWDAKFQCGERAPGIVGKARGFKTRRGAMQSAMAQTIEQALIAGQLIPNDFKC